MRQTRERSCSSVSSR